MTLNLPEPLIQHDPISIAALSSAFRKTDFNEGLKILQNWGFQPKFSKRIFQKQDYLAGSDSNRLQTFSSALKDRESKAILFARGGYGVLPLLPQIKKIKPPKKSKIIVGYSDLTCLLLYILQNWNWPVIYGPVVAGGLSHKTPQRTQRSLRQVLTDSQVLEPLKFAKAKVLKQGIVTAKLTGGCLSLICATLGTEFEIETKNKILFIEDVNEKPHAVDRMLTQLKLAGKFNGVKGIVIGSLESTHPSSHYQKVVKRVLADFKGPILFGIDAGHSKVQVSLPLGIKTRLNAQKKTLEFLQAHNK